MTDSTTPPVPIADQIAYMNDLVRVYCTVRLEPGHTVAALQNTAAACRTLSAVLSTLQRVAASADDGK